MEQQGYLTNNLINASNGKTYNTALYMRFSKDDGQTGDSSSIETQRLLLNKYCRDNDYKVYSEYVDDGFSGLNFERPDFKRMLKDIEDGKVNLVITKDQSRLGRDYIQTGAITEFSLPTMVCATLQSTTEPIQLIPQTATLCLSATSSIIFIQRI